MLFKLLVPHWIVPEIEIFTFVNLLTYPKGEVNIPHQMASGKLIWEFCLFLNHSKNKRVLWYRYVFVLAIPVCCFGPFFSLALFLKHKFLSVNEVDWVFVSSLHKWSCIVDNCHGVKVLVVTVFSSTPSLSINNHTSSIINHKIINHHKPSIIE